MKLDIGDFYEDLASKSKFDYNRTKISGTLHKDLSTFIVTGDKTAIKSLLTEKCSTATPSNALLNFHGNVLSNDDIVLWLNNTQNSLLRCRGNSGYANASQCHVIRPLHILL